MLVGLKTAVALVRPVKVRNGQRTRQEPGQARLGRCYGFVSHTMSKWKAADVF